MRLIVLLYYILCIARSLTYIMFYFYFRFIIFARKSQLSIDLSQRHVHSRKKKKKDFWREEINLAAYIWKERIL